MAEPWDARDVLAAIRARHVEERTWDAGNPDAVDGYVAWCDGCGQRPWPCDTAVVLARLVPVEAEPPGLREALEWAAKDAHVGWLLWESDHPRGYGAPHAKEFSDCTVPACAGRLALAARALSFSKSNRA